ncbi:MAG TPA: amidohydrolase family protein [Baekduia sp.]
MPIFDAHFHVIDPGFPIRENRGYLPPPFTIEDYRARTDGLEVSGGAVVSAAFQYFDQSYLYAALERLGPGFVGVTQLAPSATDAEIHALADAGVRGLRFNMVGGVQDVDDMVAVGRRVADLVDWHVELHCHAMQLPALAPRLVGLRVIVDHLGLRAEGLPDLLRLVDGGIRVKASGFGRTDLDVPDALRAITAIDPSALMFGSDLPSTRSPPQPFSHDDVQLIRDTLGERLAQRVLYDNAAAFYRIM